MSRAKELLKRVADMKVQSSRGGDLLRRLKDLKARGQVQGQMLTRSQFFNQRQLLGLDLFAGAGGFTIGALDASCPVLGIQRSPRAVQSSRAAGHQVVQMDVGALGGSQEGAIPLDVMIGGPPCQPFSSAGKGRGKYDPREGFKLVIDAVEVWKPRRIVMENVQAFLQPKHAAYRKQIYAALGKHFKHVGVWKLNAKDWGVAQDRWRVFIWAAEVPLQPPVPTHGPGTGQPYVTVKEALPGLLSEGYEAIMSFQGGATSRELANPSPTVTGRRNLYAVREPGLTYRGAGSIPRPFRLLTPDETQVLQAFPGTFDFLGNLSDRQLQIGNAVPPPLAAAVVTMVTLGLKPRRHTPTELLNALDKQYGVWMREPRPWADEALIGVTSSLPRGDSGEVPQGRRKFNAVYDAQKLREATFRAAEHWTGLDYGITGQQVRYLALGSTPQGFDGVRGQPQSQLISRYQRTLSPRARELLEGVGIPQSEPFDMASEFIYGSKEGDYWSYERLPIVIPVQTYKDLNLPLATALLPPKEQKRIIDEAMADELPDWYEFQARIAKMSRRVRKERLTAYLRKNEETLDNWYIELTADNDEVGF